MTLLMSRLQISSILLPNKRTINRIILVLYCVSGLDKVKVMKGRQLQPTDTIAEKAIVETSRIIGVLRVITD